MKQYTVSIVILTKNNQGTIDACLRGVFSQKLGGFEVVVIDSGSTDDTLKIVEKYPVRLIQIDSGEFRHGKTRNFAVKKANGKFVVFIVADAIPSSPDWLELLLGPLVDNREIAGVYGRQIVKKANPIQRFALSWNYRETMKEKKTDTTIKNVFFSNVNSAFRKEVLLRYPFDEQLQMAEDLELSKRLLEKGHGLVYAPRASVYHCHDYTLSQVFRRYFEIGRAYTFIWFREKKTNPGIQKEGFSFVYHEFSYLSRHSLFIWIPYSIFYNLSKLLGFLFGRYSELLPSTLLDKISLYR